MISSKVSDWVKLQNWTWGLLHSASPSLFPRMFALIGCKHCFLDKQHKTWYITQTLAVYMLRKFGSKVGSWLSFPMNSLSSSSMRAQLGCCWLSSFSFRISSRPTIIINHHYSFIVSLHLPIYLDVCSTSPTSGNSSRSSSSISCFCFHHLSKAPFSFLPREDSCHIPQVPSEYQPKVETQGTIKTYQWLKVWPTVYLLRSLHSERNAPVDEGFSVGLKRSVSDINIIWST